MKGHLEKDKEVNKDQSIPCIPLTTSKTDATKYKCMYVHVVQGSKHSVHAIDHFKGNTFLDL